MFPIDASSPECVLMVVSAAGNELLRRKLAFLRSCSLADICDSVASSRSFASRCLTKTLNNQQQYDPYFFLRKEVIQPQVLLRLPCYDFTPVISPTFGGSLLKGWVTDFGYYLLPWCDGRCVQDPGTYSPQHSDLRLLAIPASCSRVADYSPN